MKQAIDEDDYEKGFEYRMDQYPKSRVVVRGAIKANLNWEKNSMVVEEIVSMIQKTLNEEKPEQQLREQCLRGKKEIIKQWQKRRKLI